MTDFIKKQFQKPYQKWCNQSYKTKCYDIGQIISFTLFFIIIMYFVSDGYLDFIASIMKDQLTLSDEFVSTLTDEEKTRWMFIILGFITGVTILPLLILYYLTHWFSMFVMYLVWKIHERLSK